MKRKIVLYVLLLGIICGGAPYLTGILVETKFHDVIKVLSDADTMPVTITLTQYQRGWRKSHATTKLTFFTKGGNNKAKEYNVFIEHEIRHGPFVQLKDHNFRDWHFARAVIHSTLLLNDDAKKILITELGHAELFNINSERTIDGVVRINIDSPTLKLKEHADTNRIAWKGFQGEWLLSSDMKHFSGQMRMPGIDFDLEGVHYFAENLIYKTDLRKSPQGLWPGKFLVTLQKLSIEKPDDKFKMVLEGVASNGSMDVQGPMTDFSGTVIIEKSMINERQYGQLQYANSLKNIDARVVRSILELSHKMKTHDQSIQGINFQNLLTLIPDFLKPRPEFSIDNLQVHTSQGDVKGILNIAIGGPEASNVSNMPQILQSIVASASIVLPKVILRDLLTYQYMKEAKLANDKVKATQNQTVQNPTDVASKVLSEQELTAQVDQKVTETIAKWVKDSALVENGDNYSSDMIFKQGQLIVNGQKIDFAQPKAMMGPAVH